VVGFCPSFDHPTIEDQIPVLQHDNRKARFLTPFAAPKKERCAKKTSIFEDVSLIEKILGF